MTDSEQIRRASRIGVCFNEYEPFYWEADNHPECPACSVDDETPHGFYVAEAELEQADARRMAPDVPLSEVTWEHAYKDEKAKREQAERERDEALSAEQFNTLAAVTAERDALEAQLAAVSALVEALRKIQDTPALHDDAWTGMYLMGDIARDALANLRAGAEMTPTTQEVLPHPYNHPKGRGS